MPVKQVQGRLAVIVPGGNQLLMLTKALTVVLEKREGVLFSVGLHTRQSCRQFLPEGFNIDVAQRFADQSCLLPARELAAIKNNRAFSPARQQVGGCHNFEVVTQSALAELEYIAKLGNAE